MLKCQPQVIPLVLDGVCFGGNSMPSKKTFDLVLIVGLLLHPALGLARIGARRWSRENEGASKVIGDAIQLGML